MISVLSLVVAILAVFFGPLIARANVQRQIAVAARETWLREFREQVAALLASKQALATLESDDETVGLERTRRLTEIQDRLRPAYAAIRLLLGERGRYAEFIQSMDKFLAAPNDVSAAREFTTAAIDVLQRERAVIEVDPWWLALVGAFGWPPWSRLRTWACGRPRFPDLP